MNSTTKGDGLTPIELLRNIIVQEMELPSEHVIIYDEKFKIPPVDTLFAVIELKSARTISNRKSYDGTDPEELLQVQDLNTQERYVVGIYSRDFSAYQRKEEVAFALASDYAEQVMCKNGFQVSRILEPQDLSQLEASAMLRRFDIEVVMLCWYKKSKAVEYYDTFDVELRTEQVELEFTQKTEE